MTQAICGNTTGVVLFARAANDNRRPILDPRWSTALRNLASVGPEAVAFASAVMRRGVPFDDFVSGMNDIASHGRAAIRTRWALAEAAQVTA